MKHLGKFFCATLVASVLVPSRSFSIGEDADVRRDATVAAVEKATPSVVNIATESLVAVRDLYDDFFGDFWRPYHRQQSRQYSLGSGVIIDEDGYILTNDHVVRRADTIWVKLSNSPDIYSAKLVAVDPKTDIAIVKIDSPPGKKFTAIQLAADDDLLLGETVLAMGNPFGLGGSVSRGILSSKSRISPGEAEQLDVPNWLQTDASINPGNSGGPLVNLRGELIGLNVAILRNAQGIGFAVPLKRVRQAISEVFTPEAVNELWFGAQLKSDYGVLSVTKIQAGSPADKAGLQVGDKIIQANGKTPKSIFDLVRELVSNPRAALTVLRVEQRKTINLQLVPEKSVFNADLIYQKLGIKLKQDGDNFVIESVAPDSVLAKAKPEGVVVTGLDGKPLTDLKNAAKLLYAKKKEDVTTLTVLVRWENPPFSGIEQKEVRIPVLQ